jgi:hypothetical protein
MWRTFSTCRVRTHAYPFLPFANHASAGLGRGAHECASYVLPVTLRATRHI